MNAAPGRPRPPTANNRVLASVHASFSCLPARRRVRGFRGLDFTLSASGFTGVLALYTEQDALIGRFTGAGQHVVALLPAGTYHISVGSTDNGGRYTLTSTPVTAIADACQPTALWANTLVGATFTASHASSTCSTVIFVRGVSAGQTLSFTLTPDQSMVLGVLPPGATSPATQRTMPKGAATTLTYTIPSAGEYRIVLFGNTGSPLPIGYPLAIR